MFEKLRIHEHMEVATNAGQHIGTVDSVTDNRVYLKEGTALPLRI